MNTKSVQAGTAIFEPAMFGAVDLDQLAQSLTPQPRLMHPMPLRAAVPQTRRQHPLPQAFGRDPDVVSPGQILGRQGRPEIGIVAPDQRQDVVALQAADAVVRGPAAQLGKRTASAPSCCHLALAETQHLRGHRSAQAAVQNLGQHLDALKFAFAHHNKSHVEALMPRCRARGQPSGHRRKINFASSRQSYSGSTLHITIIRLM